MAVAVILSCILVVACQPTVPSPTPVPPVPNAGKNGSPGTVPSETAIAATAVAVGALAATGATSGVAPSGAILTPAPTPVGVSGTPTVVNTPIPSQTPVPIQPIQVAAQPPGSTPVPIILQDQPGEGTTAQPPEGGAVIAQPSLLGAGPSQQSLDPNTGTWTNVTPSNANITDSLSCGNFGTQTVGRDPQRQSDFYINYNCQGIWKSTDYGATWTGPINTGANGATVGGGAGGITVANGGPGNPPIIYSMMIRGSGLGFWRSLDGGVNWANYNISVATGGRQDWYPVAVDPYDPQHIIAAAHEFNQIIESSNGGQTWTNVPMNSGMNQSGGTAALFFIDRGNALATSDTFLYYAQGTGGSIGTWRTTNGGTSWTKVSNNEHPHGNAQIYQPDGNGVVFMSGIYAAGGWGVLRSTDYGATWANVGISGAQSTTWGTPNRVYSQYSWACGFCNVSPSQESAPAPSITGWANDSTPAGMTMGSAQVAVGYNGEQYIFVGANWTAGTWRYAEPVGVAPTATPTPTPGGPTNTPTTTPTLTPTPTNTVPPTATPTSLPTGTSVANLTVLGNKIVNGSGQQVHLVGVNKAGTEYMCLGSNLVFDGPSDTSSVNILKTWSINFVRLPINEQCWLGVNSLPQQYTATAYRTAIVNYVNLLTSQNIAVIIDLQWSAPGTQQANGLQPMPNLDHSVDFWTSAANTFKDNGSVVFDLYNEPFPMDNNDTTAAWQCLRDGCTLNTQQGTPYTAVGMQTLLNTIRATGATNVIMSPGVQFTNSLTQWLSFKPTDPLGRLAAAWHSYATQVCNTLSCWTTNVEPVLNAVPVVVGEIGQNDCQGTYIQQLMDWLDARSGNYLAWAWNTYDCNSFPSVISNYDGTPTSYGVVFRNHLLGLAGVPTPTPPPLVPFTTTFPFGIAVGQTGTYTATDGTVYYGDDVARTGMIIDKQYFTPYTTGNTITGTSDPTLYQTGRQGVYGNWTFAVPNGTYRVTWGVAPTNNYPTAINAGEFGQDETLMGQVVESCAFTSHSGPSGGCPPNQVLPVPSVNAVNTTVHQIDVFNQALFIQSAASFGGGRLTMLNTLKIEQIGGGTTPTATPTPTNTPTPTVTPTPQPVFTEGMETGALANPPWSSITQIGSGSFSRTTSSNAGTYAMQFSRTSASSSRAGVVASHTYSAQPTQYARACVAADQIPTSTLSRVAHVLGLGDPSSTTQTLAYFSIHNTNQLEATYRRRDGTFASQDVLTISSNAYRCYEIQINTSGSSPIITFRSTTAGSPFNVTATDTSTGTFTPPDTLRIGVWVDQGDPAYPGTAQVRTDDVILSNATLPTSVP